MGGESWGAGRGAWKRGQCVGQLIWAGAPHYTEACVCSGGYHPNLSCPPPLSSNTPPHPPTHPRRVSLRGFHDDPVAVALQLKKQGACVRGGGWRDGRLKCEGAEARGGGNWQSEAFQAFHIESRPVKDARFRGLRRL